MRAFALKPAGSLRIGCASATSVRLFRAARRPYKRRQEFRTGRLNSLGGLFANEILFNLAALLACASCARSITYVYYPGVASSAALSRDAEKECAKNGMKSILRGNGFSDFDKKRRPTTASESVVSSSPGGTSRRPCPNVSTFRRFWTSASPERLTRLMIRRRGRG